MQLKYLENKPNPGNKLKQLMGIYLPSNYVMFHQLESSHILLSLAGSPYLDWESVSFLRHSPNKLGYLISQSIEIKGSKMRKAGRECT